MFTLNLFTSIYFNIYKKEIVNLLEYNVIYVYSHIIYCVIFK